MHCEAQYTQKEVARKLLPGGGGNILIAIEVFKAFSGKRLTKIPVEYLPGIILNLIVSL